MNKKRQILLSAVLASALASNAQVTINVDASNPGIKVSPNLYGIFFEDINHAADGGLYAELISNRSFEDDDKNIPTWKTAAQEGAKIKAQLINKGLLNNAQGKALQLTIAAKPAATASLINEGFWGINAVQGRTYKLSFWAKGSYKGGLKARLTNAKGDKVYAETALNAKVGKKWTKYTAELTANGNDAKAQFELVADGKGTIVLDVVSLFPPTFKNRENGLRPDLAQLLYNIHPKFVRFPGGCYVEGQESPENAFHWEKTIGPIEERPGHKNVNWRYRTSDGMGFDEYLQLAEDLNAKPLYVVNVGLWHSTMKKLLAVMLAAMMLLAMVACGNNNSEPTPEPTPTPDETKTLYMATEGTFPPYEYYDGDKLVGIDVEVAGAIAEKLGMKLEVVDIAFDSIVSGVQAGKYDMGMAGMTVTDERKEQVNFSDSYSTGIQVVIVKEGGKVQSLDDMGAEGVIIGTQSGTTGFTYASSDFGDEKVKGFTKTTDAVAALINGQVDCVMLDNEPAKALVAANPDAGLSILDTAYTVEDYAIAINKDNNDLLTKVNAALAELKADGTLQGIIDKYIK